MPVAPEVARALFEYDPELAGQVLRLIAGELGAPADADVERLQAALTHMAFGEPSRKSTVEWKLDFARIERLRALGLELARIL